MSIALAAKEKATFNVEKINDIKTFRQETGLTVAQLALLFDVDKTRIYALTRLTTLPTDVIQKLEQTKISLDRAKQVFGSYEVAIEWLFSQSFHFNGKTPELYLRTESGFAEVLNVLGRIEHGIPP